MQLMPVNGARKMIAMLCTFSLSLQNKTKNPQRDSLTYRPPLPQNKNASVFPAPQIMAPALSLLYRHPHIRHPTCAQFPSAVRSTRTRNLTSASVPAHVSSTRYPDSRKHPASPLGLPPLEAARGVLPTPKSSPVPSRSGPPRG